MRELSFGGRVLPVRGGVVCRLFYRQEFGTEIEKDFTRLLKGDYERVCDYLTGRGASSEDIKALEAGDESVYKRLGIDLKELESIINGRDVKEAALRIIWAMNRAERYAVGLSTAAYAQWAKEYAGAALDGVLEDLTAEFYAAFRVTNNHGKGAGYKGEAKNLSAAAVAIGKKLGFDLRELNEMSIQGFLDVLSAYAGGTGGAVRTASQKDIDKLLG